MNTQTNMFDATGNLKPARFDGPEYKPMHDQARLTGQIKRGYSCMADGKWRTLDEISKATSDPHASISAQLRHLRKPRFGSHVVEKRPRGDRSHGLWEYRVIVHESTACECETGYQLGYCPDGCIVHKTTSNGD